MNNVGGEMDERISWLTFLLAAIAGGLFCSALVVIAIAIYEWACARIHRYKTRRERW